MIITHHADVFGRPLLKRLAMPFYSALVRQSSCVVVNSLKNVRISPDIPSDVRHVRVLEVRRLDGGFAREPIYVRHFFQRELGFAETAIVFNFEELVTRGTRPD